MQASPHVFNPRVPPTQTLRHFAASSAGRVSRSAPSFQGPPTAGGLPQDVRSQAKVCPEVAVKDVLVSVWLVSGLRPRAPAALLGRREVDAVRLSP